MRRAAKIDDNHGAIVSALKAEDLSVQSLAGVGRGVPDLLVGARGTTYLVELKDGDKRPSHRTLTPDQKLCIGKWTGSPVVLLLDVDKARSWARRISAAPSTYAGVFGRPDAVSPLGA